MLNGLGIAAAMQGDRFFVGGFLGLKEVGIYSVMVLVALMPSSLLNRFTTTVLLAMFYNAPDKKSYNSRLRLAARCSALIALIYLQPGILALLMGVGPAGRFGAANCAAQTATNLLAFAMFFRVARSEPFTLMLLQAGETRRLASANLPTASSLVFQLSCFCSFITLRP